MRLEQPWFYILLAITLAGIIHIAAVLSLPVLAPESAWSRLSALAPANRMAQLPVEQSKTQALPMLAPDVRYAFCRFDLSAGPVVLRAAVPDELWLASLYAPDGSNFYTLSGGDLKRPVVSLVIATADQPIAETGIDAPEGADETILVKSPVAEGIALIRAPLSGPSRARRAEQALLTAYCGTYHAPAAPAGL